MEEPKSQFMTKITAKTTKVSATCGKGRKMQYNTTEELAERG